MSGSRRGRRRCRPACLANEGSCFGFRNWMRDAGRRTRVRAHRQRSSDASAPSRRRKRHRDEAPFPGLVRHRRACRHRPAVEGLVHRQERNGRQAMRDAAACGRAVPLGQRALLLAARRVGAPAVRRDLDRVGVCGLNRRQAVGACEDEQHQRRQDLPPPTGYSLRPTTNHLLQGAKLAGHFKGRRLHETFAAPG